MHFKNDEIAFDVPDDWCDESRAMFVFPEVGARLCLSKRTAGADVSLAAYATELVGQMAAHWAGVEVIERREIRMGSEVGAFIEVESDGPAGRRRSLARIFVRDREVWSLTAVTPTARLEETRASIDGAMRSFAPKERSEGVGRPPYPS